VDVAAVLLAAGRGRRLAADVPKSLCLLGGEPLVARAVRALRDSGAVDQLIIVGPPGGVDEVRQVLDRCVPGAGAVVVDGAGSRHGSLHRGLSAVDCRVETVVVHDACRPLAPADLVVSVVKAVHDGADLAVPVLEVTETVKELDAAGRVARTVPRETLLRLQTPQAVRRAVLAEAHVGCAADPADPEDVGRLAGTGARVVTVAGHDDAFAVVRAHDLDFAEAVLACRRAES
jgi:2-C-methyl-D-erythritol 4-phosphate cytidylyltransferase